MDEKTTKTLLPPYLSWKTLYNYVQSLRQHMPNRIDPSGMLTLSGTNRNLVINAMKFLHLIDEGGLPQDDLRDWVAALSAADKDAEKKAVKKIIQEAYPTLFQASFNLKGSTPSEFSERFKAMKLSSETARKAETFFLEASKEAGIEISPVIIAARKKGRKAGSVAPPRRSSAGRQQREEHHENNYRENSGEYQELLSNKWYATFKPAFDLLPEFSNNPRPKWTSNEKQNFLNLVTALVSAFVDVNDKK